LQGHKTETISHKGLLEDGGKSARDLTISQIIEKMSVSSDRWSMRSWLSKDLAARTDLRFAFDQQIRQEIEQALAFVHQNSLTLNSVTQEDFRLPSLAREMQRLRRQLDNGPGFVILDTGMANLVSEPDFEIIGWAICNYFGQIMRQGIDHDLRLFTVADKGVANADPTRIGASAKRSAKHSDNGCLEPRPPCYLGLYCYQSSASGGENTIISAQTILQTIIKERPDLLPFYFDTYHFRAPQSHVWPSRGPTVEKPIFEFRGDELLVHYARVMITPGMEIARHPLSQAQIEALDYLDEVIERPELNFQTLLHAGEMLVLNNLAFLHGREAFSPGSVGGRNLKRYWMWRRHIGPGTDPALLDLAELITQE
jgi:hypothetical protein